MFTKRKLSSAGDSHRRSTRCKQDPQDTQDTQSACDASFYGVDLSRVDVRDLKCDIRDIKSSSYTSLQLPVAGGSDVDLGAKASNPGQLAVPTSFLWSQLEEWILHSIPRAEFRALCDDWSDSKSESSYAAELAALKKLNAEAGRGPYDEYVCRPVQRDGDLSLHSILQFPLRQAIKLVCLSGNYLLLYRLSDYLLHLGSPSRLSPTERQFLKTHEKRAAKGGAMLPVTARQQWLLLSRQDRHNGNKMVYNQHFGWTLVTKELIKRLAGICKKEGRGVQDWGCGKGLVSLLLAHALPHLKIEALDTFEERNPHAPNFLEPSHRLPSNLSVRTVTRPPRAWELKDAQALKEKHISVVSGHDVPNPKRTLFIAWGRDLDYAVDSYVKSGGKCIIVVGEPDGCTYHPNAKKLVNVDKFNLETYDCPNFPHIHTKLSVFTR